uniref:Serpin domain-containing protein n=1 Tax=Fundulus heteroclitus TaxID=8078 RepID=A0A3Q2UB79_FUNHE
MKLRLVLLLLCLSRPGLTEETATAAPIVTDEAEEEHVRNCGRTFSHEEHRVIGGAIEQLGLKILEKLPISPQQPNVILSPLSLAFALAHLTLGSSALFSRFINDFIRFKLDYVANMLTCFLSLQGSRNETETLLLQSLDAHKLPCFHHVLGSLLLHFSHTSLEVAARMYLRPGFDVKLSFVEESLARYRSRPFPLVSVDEVNQWVENVTQGHIPNFLESIPHDVVLMLLNGVYFKGEWKTQFDPQETSKRAFYLDSQNSVLVDMMKSVHYPLRLMDDPELQAQVTPFSHEEPWISLKSDCVKKIQTKSERVSVSHQVGSFPFKGNTSFLVVLPRGNVSSVLPRLNISDLYSRLPQEKSMLVNLPKMKLQYRQDLEEALTSMGLGSLFSDPDLSGISDQPLRVSSVRHATTVELTEEGVEAAATTVVTAMRSISLFSVNSPFLFALVDDVSLAPLFLGIVTNPAPNNDPMPNDDPHSNSTMNDQPAAEAARKTELNAEHNRLPAEGSTPQSCSAPAGGKEQSQPAGEQDGSRQTQADEPCSKADSFVPA